MTVLTDKSCTTCFEPDTFHKPILQRMGVFFGHEKRIDIASAEGKSLVTRYKIKEVPTILLSGDVDAYPVLIHAWTTVGDVASDGTYVFRNSTVTEQPYRDLSTGEIVQPITAAPVQNDGTEETQV